MADPSTRSLEPDELLRVMDAAQVIRARKERVEQEAFDQDATVRDLQVMYEELGDLVERDVIEAALDQYVSERLAFTPPPPSLRTTLARMYVRRGVIARRVGVPVAIIAGLALGGTGLGKMIERQALERDARTLSSTISSLQAEHQTHRTTLEQLRASPVVANLPGDAASAFAARTQAAERQLVAVAELLTAIAVPEGIPAEPTRAQVDALLSRVEGADLRLRDAELELMAAGEPLLQEERRAALAAEVPRVLGAILEAAREPGVAGAQEEIAANALRQAVAGDLAGLEASVGRLRSTLAALEREYRVEIVGGVWRYSADDPGARRYYLRVQAIGPAGAVVPVEVRDEESGLTSVVREWGERVPKEVYDRVGADKQDDGIIDEKDFATKRRGWLTPDRRLPDVGQITSWD